MKRYHYFIYLIVARWQKILQHTPQNYTCKASTCNFTERVLRSRRHSPIGIACQQHMKPRNSTRFAQTFGMICLQVDSQFTIGSPHIYTFCLFASSLCIILVFSAIVFTDTDFVKKRVSVFVSDRLWPESDKKAGIYD